MLSRDPDRARARSARRRGASPGTRSASPRPPRRWPGATRSCTWPASRSPSAGATRRKRAIRDSRASSARATSSRACAPPSRARASLVSASAVGYYGPHGDERVDEDDAARRRLPRRGRASPGSARRDARRASSALRVVHAAHRRRARPRRRRAGEDAAAVPARRRRPGRRRAPVHAVDPRRRPRRASTSPRSTATTGAGPVNATRARAGHQPRLLARRSAARCTGPPSLPVPGFAMRAALRRHGRDRHRRASARCPTRALALGYAFRAPRPRRGAARRARATVGRAVTQIARRAPRRRHVRRARALRCAHPRSRELFERARARCFGGVPMTWMTKWAAATRSTPRGARRADRGRRRPRLRRLLRSATPARWPATRPPPTVAAVSAAHRRAGRRSRRCCPTEDADVGRRGAAPALRPAALELHAHRDRRQPLGAAAARAQVTGARRSSSSATATTARSTRPSPRSTARRPRSREGNVGARRSTRRETTRGRASSTTSAPSSAQLADGAGRVRAHRAGADQHRHRPARARLPRRRCARLRDRTARC